MANEPVKANRTLQIKIRTPSADSAKMLATMMKNSAPMYAAFGGARIRLLRNIDDPAQFVQIIDYQADPTFELNRQKLSSDPMARNIVQAWRMMFPGAIEIDVFEDVTEAV
jgi:hypothetical protein